MRSFACSKKTKEAKMTNLEKIIRVSKITRHESDPTKLLKLDDWSKITTEQLQQYIDDGYTVDWGYGRGAGATPLTNALMQDAAPEIIDILVANGADVNYPTVLPNGKKITPLQIVRSKEPTHENVQIELLLLRSGAKDDIVDWLKKHKKDVSNPGQAYSDLSWMFKKGYDISKNLHFLGYYDGAKVFECGPSYYYIFEHAGEIWWDVDFDIYDKGLRLNHFSGPEPEWLNNELGNNFAKQFFAKCEQLRPNVAIDQYYTYLCSLYFFSGKNSERINAAHKDFREKNFSYDDWSELIAITHNITACAEYSKIRKAKFPKIYAMDHKDDKE